MNIREATMNDIPQLKMVRNAVLENALSNPDLITDDDYKTFLNIQGKGWVYEIKDEIVGFAIVDLQANNVWALFLKPANEKQGFGKLLHDRMLDWYFKQTEKTLWLGTAAQTRAETFYRERGWIEVGTNGKKEIKFEMTYQDWQAYRIKNS